MPLFRSSRILQAAQEYGAAAVGDGMRARAVPYSTHRPITASAERVVHEDHRTIAARPYTAWQEDAWRHFERIGEVHFGFTLVANVLSRVRLYPSVLSGRDEVPAEAGAARDDPDTEIGDEIVDRAIAIMDDLLTDDPTSMLRSFGLNMSVAGECYLADIPGTGWAVRSTSELEPVDGGYRQRLVRGGAGMLGGSLPESMFVARIWRQHPRWSKEPDSSMAGISESCEELMMLSRLTRTVARSRLNAGMMFVPDSVSVASATVGAEEVDEVDPVTGEPIVYAPMDQGNVLVSELFTSMTAPIADEENAASIVPVVFTGPAEAGAAIRHITFDRKNDDWLAARADRALERILQGIDVPKDVVTGLACVDEQTEIYTRDRGWQHRTGIQVGDHVLTLNHETGRSEWQPVLDMHVYEHSGPMLRMQSVTHDSLTTEGHRWPVLKTGRKVSGSRRRWTTSGQGFTTSDRIQIAALIADTDTPTEPKYADDFVRLVALYTSDGWLEAPARGRPRANISKYTESIIQQVRGIMPSGTAEYPVGAGVRFRLTPEASEALFAVASGVSKIVDREFVLSLTAAQLELFLSSFAMFGDGVRLSTGMRYWQSEPERLDAIELAAVLTGRAVRRVAPVTEQANEWGGISGELHGLTVSDSPRRVWMQPSKADSAWEDHEGTVWCPTTQNGTWFARRGRTVYFTGNSVKYSNAVIINEDLYKAHIEPMVLTFVDALTSVYLRPRLRADGFSDNDIRRMAVWYDPSEIVVRPNRAADATSGYDRFILGPRAWLREHGFSESDMPTEEEIAMMLASGKATPPPDVTAALYQALLPGLLGSARAEAVAESPVPFPKSALDALGGRAS